MAERSNLSLCYEGILRVYRNALVSLIRARLSKAFPDAVSRLETMFSAEWRENRERVLQRKQAGQIDTELRDDFDLLGVNHFFNLFDVYFEEVVPSDPTLKETPEIRKKKKQSLLQWTKTIKALRDPLSHPAEHDFSFEDAFVLLDCARRVLLTLGLDEHREVQLLMDSLTGRRVSLDPGGEAIEDRLPPREAIVVDFVGRDNELDILWEWFLDPTSRRWALAGEGGKGKSALAFKFAAEVKFRAPQPFQIVLWISAKKTRFIEGTQESIENRDFVDLSSALDRLLSHYGWSEEAESPLESRKERLLDLLNSFPALLIVDDIDSLEGMAEDALEFFSFSVPQTKSKVLFTSRRVIFGMGNSTTHVSGLTQSDALKFVQSRCKILELPASSILGHIAEIMRVTEGSPLFIEDLLRLCAIVPTKDATKMWAEKGGNDARQYALGRELEQLSRAANEVLVAACARTSSVTYSELTAVTGLTTDVLNSALLELQKLFLVPKPQLIEGEQRYNVNLNTRLLVRKVQGNSDLWRRTEAAYKAISGQMPRQGSRPELSSTVRRALLLLKNDQHSEAEGLMKSLLEKNPNDPGLMSVLGLIYKAWRPPRLTDARAYYARAAQLKCPNENTYRHWAQMEIDQHEWAKAFDAAERGIQNVGETRQLLFLAAFARSRYGRELLTRLQQADAKVSLSLSQEYLRKAMKATAELSNFSDRQLNANIYRALVLNCEAVGDVVSMREYFDAWLGEHPDDALARSEWERLALKYHLSRRPATATGD